MQNLHTKIVLKTKLINVSKICELKSELIMSLKGYILRRILYIVPVMIVITLMNFTLINIAPGDPVLVRVGLIKCETPECYNNAYNKAAIEMGLMSPNYYTVP